MADLNIPVKIPASRTSPRLAGSWSNNPGTSTDGGLTRKRISKTESDVSSQPLTKKQRPSKPAREKKRRRHINQLIQESFQLADNTFNMIDPARHSTPKNPDNSGKTTEKAEKMAYICSCLRHVVTTLDNKNVLTNISKGCIPISVRVSPRSLGQVQSRTLASSVPQLTVASQEQSGTQGVVRRSPRKSAPQKWLNFDINTILSSNEGETSSHSQ